MSWSTPVIYAVPLTRQKIEQKMDELAREYRDTHDPEIPETIFELARRLREMDHLKVCVCSRYLLVVNFGKLGRITGIRFFDRNNADQDNHWLAAPGSGRAMMAPSQDQSEVSEPAPKLVEKWAALAGRWTFSPVAARYLGLNEQSGAIPLGVALGSIPFRDGKLTTTVRLTRQERTSGGVVLGYQSMNAEWLAVQIGGYGRGYAIAEYRPGVGFTGIATAGLLSNLPVDQDQVFEVSVAGQRVAMTVNDVRVLEVVLPRPLEGIGAGLFAWDDAEVVFTRTEITTIRPRIFIIMPFSEPFDTLYREVIRPVSERLEFEIVRVDEIAGPGIIVDDIQRQISQAQVAIAEIRLAQSKCILRAWVCTCA